MKQHLAIVAVVVLIQTTAFADGATVQFRRSFGELNVTLFASPRPMAAGLIGLSLLIPRLCTQPASSPRVKG
jgi:hypothetical protein